MRRQMHQIIQMVGYLDHGTGHLNHLKNEPLKVHYSDPYGTLDPHCTSVFLCVREKERERDPFSHAVAMAVVSQF